MNIDKKIFDKVTIKRMDNMDIGEPFTIIASSTAFMETAYMRVDDASEDIMYVNLDTGMVLKGKADTFVIPLEDAKVTTVERTPQDKVAVDRKLFEEMIGVLRTLADRGVFRDEISDGAKTTRVKDRAKNLYRNLVVQNWGIGCDPRDEV